MRIGTPCRICAWAWLSISVIGVPAIASECQDMEPREALADVRQTYMDGFNAGDVDAVMSVHTADTVQMPAGMETIRGQEAVRALVEESARLMPEGFEFRFEPVEVHVAEDFAVERGVTAGTETIPAGKYVLMYVREDDGCWRIAWSITNSDATPPDRR